MSDPLGLAAYLAFASFSDKPALPQVWPDRPNGAVIWVWCPSVDDLAVARTVSAQFAAEGDEATFLITLPATPELAPAANEIFLPFSSPGRLAVRSFVDHWMPDLLLWMHGRLDPVVLTETDTLGIERLLIDAQARVIRPSRGRWIPRLVRPLLSRIDHAFASDEAAKVALERAKYPTDRIEVLGPLQDAVPVPACDEVSRAELSSQLATRPLWCASDVSLDKAPLIAAAHKRVSRRAHRLLLLAAPDRNTDPEALATAFREAGFDTLVYGTGREPSGATQVLVADSADKPGLWFRLAPITFLCGSLENGSERHPFEVVALGSALIHGPAAGPFDAAYRQLEDARASRPITEGAELAVALEELLAPDRSALIAMAGWDVTSRSAAVTNRMTEAMRAALEKAGY